MSRRPGAPEQVIWNLIVNAGQFTPAGGRIVLESSATAEAGVTVTDNGVGIARDMLEQVFDPFIVASATRSPARRPGHRPHAGQAHRGVAWRLRARHQRRRRARQRIRASAARAAGARRRGASRAEALCRSGARPRQSRAASWSSTTTSTPPRVCVARWRWRLHDVDVVHDGVAAVEAAEAAGPRRGPARHQSAEGWTGWRSRDSCARAGFRMGSRRPLLVATTGLGRDVDRERTRRLASTTTWSSQSILASLESLLASRPSTSPQ